MTGKKRKATTRNYEEWLIPSLKDPGEAAAYLTACLEDGDPKVFLLALSDVARAYGGLLKLSQKTKLSRVNLYRILSKTGNPELRSLERILHALGFRLAVEANPSTQKKKAA